MSFRICRLNIRDKEIRFNLLAICAVLLLYCANRFFDSFAGILPTAFLKYHFNDLCGGIIFPAYVNTLLIFFRSNYRVDCLYKIFVLELICSLAWEVIAPMFLSRSTGDLVDAFMYFIGGSIYCFMRYFSQLSN